MNVRTPLVAALAAALLLAAAPAAHAGTGLPGSVEIACADTALTQDARWYLPAGAPRALVWVQHGFARASGNVADLAGALADRGYLVFTPDLPFVNPSGCTLQNLGDNTGFLHHVAELFGTSEALAASLAAAAHRAGRSAPPLPADLVFLGHSAGAEAVAAVAEDLRVTSPATWARLRAVILLDPVKSFLGDNLGRAVAGIDITALPLLEVAAPPSPCNSFGTGTDAVRSGLHRPFLGVRLPEGAHTDAEGASSDALGELLCGVPAATAVATVRTLALGWTDDAVDGARTPALYPDAAGTVAAAPGAEVLRGG